MHVYHKIKTVYLRDPETNFKTLLEGQYATPEFEFLAESEWVFTEKVDGTNIRVMFDGEKITFGGKTDRAQLPAPLVERLQERFLPQLDVFQAKFPDGVCLYGEGYGAKIQKGGGLYRDDQDFVLFDAKVGQWWLLRDSVTDIAETLGIDEVPVIGSGSLPDFVEMARAGFSSTWGDFPAEGLIARLPCELMTRDGHRIITKIKCRDFAA